MMRRAFTLFELIMTLTVFLAVAAVVVPRMSDDTQLRLMAAAALLESDLEYVQALAISHPQQPLVLRFGADRRSWWVADADTPDTPVARPDTGDPYRVELGTGSAASAAGMTFAVTDLANDAAVYDAFGSLPDPGQSPRVEFRPGTSFRALTIEPSTGFITQSAGQIDGEGEKKDLR